MNIIVEKIEHLFAELVEELHKLAAHLHPAAPVVVPDPAAPVVVPDPAAPSAAS